MRGVVSSDAQLQELIEAFDLDRGMWVRIKPMQELGPLEGYSCIVVMPPRMVFVRDIREYNDWIATLKEHTPKVVFVGA